ncbi:hypothetical protein [Streptomyces sp. NPDC051684]|uniref:hypothetical protein n=1 Tax=Streptomyces sp. NPDC051684 TaxID=3365670 RepID=UPI00378B1087
MSETAPARLLPWPSENGRSAYLVTDNPDGYLSRLADRIEHEQLVDAREVLALSRDLLVDVDVAAIELLFIARRLTESLTQTLRIADSRGARLTPPPPP